MDVHWNVPVTIYKVHCFWIVDREILNLGTLLNDEKLRDEYVDIAIGSSGMPHFFIDIRNSEVVFLSGSQFGGVVVGFLLLPYYSHIVWERTIRRLGMDPCQFYRDVFRGELSRKTIDRYHELLAREYYSEAIKAESEGDFRRAAELYWETIRTLLRMINREKGFSISRDKDYYWEVISAISDETKDSFIKTLFEIARRLESYNKFERMSPNRFKIYSDVAKKLIERLRKLLDEFAKIE